MEMTIARSTFTRGCALAMASAFALASALTMSGVAHATDARADALARAKAKSQPGAATPTATPATTATPAAGATPTVPAPAATRTPAMTPAASAPTPAAIAAPAPPPATGMVQLRLIPPPDGFRRGRAAAVMVVSLDVSNAISDAAASPTLKTAGATASAAAKVAPGIWRVEVTPGESAPALTLDASLGASRGSLSAPVRTGGEATLEVTLSKSLVTPGERAPVVATVVARDPAGAPFDAVTPSVEATAGTAQAPVRVDPGRWEARIKLPEERFPQALQVVAFIPTRDIAPARAILVLEGRASIPLTTKPKSKVTVRVGKRSWGPLLADVHGSLEAEIEAAPSENSMEVESVDEVGNKSTRSVPIDAPPYTRVWARADAGAPGLDARVVVTASAFLLDHRGRPIEDAKATATVGGETVKLVSAGGLLTGRTRLALAPGKAPVEIEAGEERKSTAVTATTAPAVAVSVKVTPEQVVVGGAPAAVNVELIDAAGRAIGGGKVALSGEGIGLSDVQSLPGRVTAAASLAPGVLPPNAAVIARAEGPGFSIAGRHPMTTVAGAPAKAEMLLDPRPMIADGSSTVTVGVRFFDAWGNPVKGLKPVAQISAGSAEIPSEIGDGTYKLSVRAPNFAGPSRIAVDSGAAHTEGTIVYLRPPTSTSLAAGLGVVSNLGALTSEQLWMEGRRTIRGPWTATLRVTGLNGTFRLHAFNTGYNVSIQQEIVMLGARRMFGSSTSMWTGSAGLALGGGVAQVAVRGIAAPPGKGGLVTGGRLCGTAERRAGSGTILLEAGYGQITGSGSLVKSNVSGADFTVGYRHGF